MLPQIKALYRSIWQMHALLPLLLLPIYAKAEDRHLDDPDLFHFVTRPDLRPPKWELTVYNNCQLSPGYWFSAPKQARERTLGTGAAWMGPAIYDGNGELVWSGTTQLDSPNVMDFRVNEVGGKQLLTMLDRDRRSGVLLDNRYRIRHVVDVVRKNNSDWLNGHEFKLVDNGRRVLVIRNHNQEATQREKDAAGFDGDVCWATYNELIEMDVETGEMVFKFNSHGQIGIDESNTKEEGRDVAFWCSITWDFMHANSADKCDDGHYLFNARHTDTIYKISKDNGSIIWRLGGMKSDFHMEDITFSRQHDIRFRGQNQTHTLISILDNAKGEDDATPTYSFSRGLLLALNTINMTASKVAHYDHPDKAFAPRRGNMQMLDNGNVFMGWSERAQQSEHAADGTLLMQARLAPEWLGSYRNYKFEYVGRPLTRPDVHAAVYFGQRNETITRVYVSWNGDTEVRRWNLYGVSADGNKHELIAEAKRMGFETYLEWAGYASYIWLDGVDKGGKVVGKSGVIKTIEHPSDPDCETQADPPETTPDKRFENGIRFHEDL